MIGRDMRAPIRGLVDGAGRLVEADGPLAELNARAGGAPGEPLAVPQLSGLVRLVRRLGIPVSRGVYAADGDRDLDLWVRASPDGEGGAVALAVVAWTETVSRTPFTAPPPERARDFGRGATDWRWAADRHLRLTAIDPSDAGGGAVGQPLTRLFALQAAAGGGLPMMEAMGDGRGFDGQPAWPMGDATRPMRLAASALTDVDGTFAGYAGRATFVDTDPAVPDPADASPAFGERLGLALREPLNRIIAGAEAIREGEATLRRDYAGYAGDIASAGRHLLGLVDDLVDLQTIEGSDFRVRDEALDLADVARRAAGLLAVRATRTGVRIDPPAETDMLPARGEFGRALQILVNLTGNAIRYSPAGGTVWIRGERDGARMRIVVADQGQGIAVEDQERVFAKFERIDPHEPGGTGLGLYIARRLARAMGGDILLDSAIGDGARFMLVLPAG